ncbi:DUF6169 family protein [Flavobacterium nackdongense]|uniref:Uncharacterized protein n=1 Tax=Flavobacterium nackdongense TaxID=2547394 RepID=A0A4P6Y991_9FLAO|nr:DUF6169 family protein [Flavobacterium nackdongense]QBN18538.1 hypothetical protein E1750_06855 [Flavobacterium nackdongense]
MSYNFYFEGGQNNSYFFETVEGILYEVIFKFTPYLFDLKNVEIIENTFEFSLLLKYNPNSKLPSNDKKIGATVVAIFMDFYAKRSKAISVYICDSADGKELVRKRKFDQWFLEYNDETFVKVDEMLVDKHNNKFPISLIFSKSNPYRIEIFEAFVQMSMNNRK